MNHFVTICSSNSNVIQGTNTPAISEQSNTVECPCICIGGHLHCFERWHPHCQQMNQSQLIQSFQSSQIGSLVPLRWTKYPANDKDMSPVTIETVVEV